MNYNRYMKRRRYGKKLERLERFIDETDDVDESDDHPLLTSQSLSFLEETRTEDESDSEGDWSLHADGKTLEPLRFSNGKTQTDIVKEIAELIHAGKNIIFLHGMCGTGKSAIALNLARQLGKAAIVVPIKSLQRQYEEDYTKKKYVLKRRRKMKIAMITGRENHDSLFLSGVSCADPFLPDTIAITEKNREKILSYYEQNPFISSKEISDVRKLRRISIAPTNPYWSPLLSADVVLSQLTDARKKIYRGVDGRDFIFYHRKEGCSYYDQYLAYLYADILIFNAAKYKIEMAIGRKPQTEIDIIDEADSFLDGLSMESSFSLAKLAAALRTLSSESQECRETIDALLELLALEEKRRGALGVDAMQIFQLRETFLNSVLRLFLKSSELQAELALDEFHYANIALEAAYQFEHFSDETYVTFSRDKETKEVIAHLITINLSKRFAELRARSKTLVFMSGTLHSAKVLKEVFCIKDFAMVQAETLPQGTLEVMRSGKEIDCRYAHFVSGKYTREQYLHALEACVKQAPRPTLVHVNAFGDLPSEEEIARYGLQGLISKEQLLTLQKEDMTGKRISLFKEKLIDVLFTTKASRGVDFPGDVCNSVVFTKYPNPHAQGTFWKILKRTHPEQYWEFYHDKARREFLQRIYRALRSKEDHVVVLSPDTRVLEAVQQLQTLSRA